MARSYSTSRAIRKKKRVDIIFIVVAIFTILLQILLLTQYLEQKSSREDLSQRYATEEKALSDLTQQRQALEKAIAGIETELDDLNKQAAALE